MTAGAHAGSARLIEVSSGSRTYSGRVIAMNDQTCCLQDRFGVIERLSVSELRGFRVISDQFRMASASDFRARLRTEFPGTYEVAGSAHYVVCAPRGRAAAYCQVFETVFHQVERFYRVHGFAVHAPEGLMSAVIFGSQEEFRSYCRADDVTWSPELQGYYSLRSNRIALYDQATHSVAAVSRSITPSLQPAEDVGSDLLETPQTRMMFSVSPDAADTIVHETTHQTGYNIGIHSRTGSSPAWILEGLATVLEADGIREATSSAGRKSRINASRLTWFIHEYASRRKAGDLASLVADDQFFHRNPLDGYSLAWAFTYYMTDSPARTQQFVRYLRLVESRDPQSVTSAEQRLADFTSIFGDISRMEVDFTRFMDRLE